MSQLQQYRCMDGTGNTNKKTVNKNQGKNKVCFIFVNVKCKICKVQQRSNILQVVL